MHDPELVIMDEPTSGLDPLKQEEFNEFVRKEREGGKTLFFSSHVLSEVRRICDRVGILRDGKLVGLEDVETLIGQGGMRVRLRTTDEARADLTALNGVIDVQTFADGLQFIYTGEYNALLRELATHDVREIKISEPPLEDIFLHYYGADGSAESNQEVHSDA
ncbi:ABC transporter-like protein [Halosimplex carlsbadense 2-9-1]|uniref:ABC transporter-like protein n=2 Tax=Halosimplex carlsbadense TaxID=171164 RepID=M0CG97_9EURY|nr:ABC transporter-like protein [Halosimplex carlsbadense 2-9-1]